jgi:hypothetical protein
LFGIIDTVGEESEGGIILFFDSTGELGELHAIQASHNIMIVKVCFVIILS